MINKEQIDSLIEQIARETSCYRREYLCENLLKCLNFQCAMQRITDDEIQSPLSDTVIEIALDVLGCCEYDGDRKKTEDNLLKVLKIIYRKRIQAKLEWDEKES